MVKKIVYVICACIAIFYLSLLLIGDLAQQKGIGDESGNPLIIGDAKEGQTVGEGKEDTILEVPDYAITRGLAAKAMALTFYDYSELLTMDTYINFKDCSEEDWYFYYVNVAIANGWMLSDEDVFNPYGLLTEIEAKELFSRVCEDYNGFDMTGYDLKTSDPISYDAFIALYTELIQVNQENIQVSASQLFVYSTQLTDEQLGPWQVATDKGIYDFGGLSLDGFIDKEAIFIANGNKILFVEGILEELPLVTNAYVSAINNEEITLFLGGSSRKLLLDLETDVSVGSIVDFIDDQGTVKELSVKEEKDQGVIKRVNSDEIELAHKSYEFAEEAKIYSNYNGQVRWLGKSDLLVGSNTSTFIIEDKKVCGVIMNVKPHLEKIRVALNSTGFKGLVHGEVKVTCDGPFLLESGNEIKEFAANDTVIIGGDGMAIGDKRVSIYPKNDSDRIKVITIDRGYGETYRQPSYRGIIEVAKQDEGYSIVNELPIEEYLYAVVPSEMPSSYGVEASKVQAITARSYAYNQMYGNRYYRYGAHVDDSVNCQVYNNIPENETSITAVEETKGLGLKSGESVVSANFFSTSCGYTANSGDVWANSSTGQFPQNTPTYLSAAAQYSTDFNSDLTDEEVFYQFISTDQVDAYDESFTWYRWNVTMSREEIEASINYNLKDLYESKPHLVRTLDENSIFRSNYIDGVGELIDVNVYKRGEGGNIMEMIVEGSERTVKVSTEYHIRKLIRPVQYIEGEESIKLYLQNDVIKDNYSVMPSAFYSLEKVKDDQGNLIEIKFIGGGYGHGVGMSQNGVKGMVDLGYNYQSILEHFYQGIKIEPIF
ncbi:SpoIID/LytB domain-containing protein [Vallitalea okinawensis]|uniref:SpoIID/LytB domain-containing protein n=1 Tax=Vallitalea okinawensis TaxID=2078660 RepID=UPI000CFACA85|nr:SpoIID/LytB domain-containing protein [Vallitalea okinawensis]